MSYSSDDSPLIHRPDAKDLELALQTGEVCGNCRYFELAHGQQLMRATKFVAALVREQGWKPEYLCSPINELGVCGARRSGAKGENEMVTGRMHKGCDQFRPGNGLVSLTRKTTDPR